MHQRRISQMAEAVTEIHIAFPAVRFYCGQCLELDSQVLAAAEARVLPDPLAVSLIGRANYSVAYPRPGLWGARDICLILVSIKAGRVL
jgi:hypothetical protein